MDSYCSYNSNSWLNYINANFLYYFLTCFTFIVIFIFLFILNKSTYFDRCKIPRGNRPTAPYGNIKDVLFRETTLYIYLWKYYNRFKRKGYKFGGLYLFLKPSFLIINPNIIYKILITDNAYFVDVCNRKKSMPNYRKISNLFTDNFLDNYLSKYDNLKVLLKKDFSKESYTTVLNNFFLESANAAFGFSSSLDFLNLVKELMQDKHVCGFWHYFQLVYSVFKFKKSNRDHLEFVTKIVESRKKNDIKKDDLIDGLIDLINEGESFEEMAWILLDNFVDIVTLSYNAVLFCLYEIASNEDIQQELIRELKRFGKGNMEINLDNLNDLIFLEAVVKETLRKYPPIPTIFKECTKPYKNFEIGLNIPKGSFAFITIFGIHHDPLNYADPETFDPDRFFEENIKFIKPNTYMPFGFGARNGIDNCQRFITLQMKLALIGILQSYKVLLTISDYTIQFDNDKAVISPKEPLPLKFELLS